MIRLKPVRTLLIGALVVAAGATAVTIPLITSAATTTRYEAESAHLFQVVVATNHAGFTGSGFVDYNGVAGSYVEFTVTASKAGTATLNPVDLYLYGQYLVYRRTHDPKLLTFIQNWADRFVKPDGTISNSFTSLDSMEPGLVLTVLYKETGLARYKTAATTIYNRLEGGGYPRTADNGLQHAVSRPHQLWADGAFMSLPFLVNFGNLVGTSEQKTRAYADAID